MYSSCHAFFGQNKLRKAAVEENMVSKLRIPILEFNRWTA